MQSELEISTGHTFQTLSGLNIDICVQRVLSCPMCTVGNNDTSIYAKILCNQRVYKITFFLGLEVGTYYIYVESLL